jgi:glyoxylase I family protein
MARVTGIGGFFFRARDPDALDRWYAEHFGVVMIDSRDYDDPGWFQDRGETVFSAFSHDSDSFGAPEKTWKINAASMTRDQRDALQTIDRASEKIERMG